MRRTIERLARHWRGPPLRVVLPNGAVIAAGPAVAPEEGAVLRIRRPRAIRRALARGDIGFAEGYLAGDWETDDLARLLTALAAGFEGLERLAIGAPWRSLFERLSRRRLRSRAGARRNIEAHYDLGNRFFAAWLDPGMTYSGAVFARPDDSLEAAQAGKLEAVARAVHLARDEAVLEIGCGWGGFAEYAASRIGAKVTAITVSPAQHAFASARIHRAGLSERAKIELCDWRDVRGRFDKLVSIEMLEAVGESGWAPFFAAARARLAPAGRAGLQVITIREDLFEAYRRRRDFIQRHVFPGGMLISETRMRAAAERAGFAWSTPLRFGADYAATLRQWAKRFAAAWPELRGQGFDERFRRLWTFYLAYCEAGFAVGRTDVIQVALSAA